MSDIKHLQETVNVVLDKLKTSADHGPSENPDEFAKLSPSESMLTYRLLTEHLGVRHE